MDSTTLSPKQVQQLFLLKQIQCSPFIKLCLGFIEWTMLEVNHVLKGKQENDHYKGSIGNDHEMTITKEV